MDWKFGGGQMEIGRRKSHIKTTFNTVQQSTSIIKNIMEITGRLLERAIIYATEKHKGQIRKGDGKPYILHPIGVMMIMSKIKKTKNFNLLATCCLAHDIVEDCGVSLQEIADEFGYNVASIVQELTSDKDQIKKIGKEEYLLEKMLKMSSYALVIKLCDRLHNLQDMESMDYEFKSKTISQTTYIIDGLVERKLTSTHNKLIKEIKKLL